MGESGGSNTGGDSESTEQPGWTDNDSGTLWGWLDSVVSGLASLWESIASIPSDIVNAFKGFFDILWGYLQDLWDAIKSIPQAIVDGIREIFIPDVEELEATLDATVDNISSQLGVQFNTLDRLFDREAAPEDVTTDYELAGVGTLSLKIMDTDWLIRGVALMRPYIRGFMVILLVLFSWSQVMSFIDQNPNIAHTAQQNYQKWVDSKGGGDK